MEQLLKNWKLRMVKYRQESDNANSPITRVKAMNKFFILRDCIKELEEAMHYARSCATLKDKKKITFNEWLSKWNWERVGSSYTFKRGESYTDAESLMIIYKKEYSL